MFSRATIMDVMYLLKDMNSHSQLNAYSFRYGLEDVAIGNNKEQRVLEIGKYLLNNPNASGLISNNLTYEIVEGVIRDATNIEYHYNAETNEFVNYPQLRRLLLKDGFIIEEGNLIRKFDTDINFKENETLLNKLLNKYNFTVAKGHLEQANNAFNRGDWASCNSQLRSYVEEIFNEIAERITGKTYTNSHAARADLSNCNPPIFYSGLNEWLNDGKGFFETFWRRLHPQGSHPGLSDEDDSVFRLTLVQITTLEVLRRFDDNYS